MKCNKTTIITILCISSSLIMAQDADLIHQYKFDGNLEDAVGDSNGVVAGGAGTTPVYIEGHDGTANGAILFPTDAATWYMVDVGRFSPSQEGRKNEMTVTFWAYWNGATGHAQDIINKRDHYSDNEMMWGINQHDFTGHVLSVHVPSSMTNSSQGIPVGVWTHVAISIDILKKARFYMNGVLYDTQDFTYGTGTDAMIHIGTSAQHEGANVNDIFNGALDDVRFYSRKLSDAAIYNIFDPPPTLALTSGIDTQTVIIGNAIDSIVYTWGGGSVTDVTISDLPPGLDTAKDTIAKTITISGTPTDTGTYNYTLTTVQNKGNTISLSGTITVIEEPSSIIYGENEIKALLFPNPAGHSIQIKGLIGRATVSVMDLQGKLLVKRDVSSNEIISLDELPQGVYILKIATKKGAIINKIIKK